MKKKTIKKILEIYLYVFCFFAMISVAYVLTKIFMYFGMNNKIVEVAVLVITIGSFIGLFMSEDILKDNKKNE